MVNVDTEVDIDVDDDELDKLDEDGELAAEEEADDELLDVTLNTVAAAVD